MDAITTTNLSPRQAKRLAALRAATEGAQAVAQAAQQAAQQVAAAYQAALTAVLEADGVDTTADLGVNHDAERGILTSGPRQLMEAQASATPNGEVLAGR